RIQAIEVGSADGLHQFIRKPVGAVLVAPGRAERTADVEAEEHGAIGERSRRSLQPYVDSFGNEVVALQQRDSERRRPPPDHVSVLGDLTTRRKFSRSRFPCSVPIDSGWNCTP